MGRNEAQSKRGEEVAEKSSDASSVKQQEGEAALQQSYFLG
jgi:hypothetical protein